MNWRSASFLGAAACGVIACTGHVSLGFSLDDVTPDDGGPPGDAGSPNDGGPPRDSGSPLPDDSGSPSPYDSGSPLPYDSGLPHDAGWIDGSAPAGPSGSIDTSFGQGGKAELPWIRQARAITVQWDGKIVVGGQGQSEREFVLTRLDSSGGEDQTFGTYGHATTRVGQEKTTLDSLLWQGGKLLAVGIANDAYTLPSDLSFARFLSNGALDSTFGSGGTARVDLGRDEWAQASVVAPDDRIVVTGAFKHGVRTDGTFIPSSCFVTRLFWNGARDTSFGTVDLDFGASGCTAVALQPDGKIVVAGSLGSYYMETDESVRLVRLNRNGTLDTTFGSGGLVTIDLGRDGEPVRRLRVLPNGKILVLAHAWNVNATVADRALIQLLPSGALDPTFGSGGITREPTNGRAFVVQPDGKIIVVGEISRASEYFHITRYLSNGSPDPLFGAGGRVTGSWGLRGSPEDVALAPDGRIVIAGKQTGDNFFRAPVARYWP